MAPAYFDITFRGVDELRGVSESRVRLLDVNVRAAVARTVLWGAGRIAEDCPVDTGRLRSSILGYLAQRFGVNLSGNDPTSALDGINQSLTKVDGYQGQIGTNVKYARQIDLGVRGERQPLTAKQLRFLFYKGILRKGSNGEVIYTYRKKGTRGKGFFSKNIPVIDSYFQNQMHEAIEHAKRGELMRVTF